MTMDYQAPSSTPPGLQAIDFVAFIVAAIMTLAPLAATAFYYR